jgi:predicted outer membrane protein
LHELLQIERQINERCLQMARDELQQKSGAEFDKCFVGGAIGAHAHALAALEVIGKQRQGQLSQVAQQALPTVQQHFEQAKQLMKQLEGQSSAKGTQAQRDSRRTE